MKSVQSVIWLLRFQFFGVPMTISVCLSVYLSTDLNTRISVIGWKSYTSWITTTEKNKIKVNYSKLQGKITNSEDAFTFNLVSKEIL
jgi:hypothetical protein